MPPSPDRFLVSNDKSGLILAKEVHLAGSSSARRKGLLAHSEMPPGFGLWIVPSEAVHTFFMRFPIDLVFLSRDKVVIKLMPRVKPWRIVFALRGHSVLELESGAIERAETSVGDHLRFTTA